MPVVNLLTLLLRRLTMFEPRERSGVAVSSVAASTFVADAVSASEISSDDVFLSLIG